MLYTVTLKYFFLQLIVQEEALDEFNTMWKQFKGCITHNILRNY